MRLQDLYKYEKLSLLLLAKLNIITVKEIIFPVVLSPDDNISQYGREYAKDYFFHNEWSFKPLCKSVIKVEIIGNRVYNSELLKEQIDDYEENSDISLYVDDYNDVERTLNDINSIDETFFLENGCEADEVNDFKLLDLRIRNIDNHHQKICYEGGFFGDSVDMDTITSGWELFSKISLIGVHNQIKEFYKELLAESYLLYINENYKLSYFIAYSAFECFVNTKGGTQDQDGRLKDKISTLYGSKFNDLSKHQIYTSVIDKFNQSDKKRNDIAHGREEITINRDDSEKMLLHVSVLMLTYNDKLMCFDELDIT